MWAAVYKYLLPWRLNLASRTREANLSIDKSKRTIFILPMLNIDLVVVAAFQG